MVVSYCTPGAISQHLFSKAMKDTASSRLAFSNHCSHFGNPHRRWRLFSQLAAGLVFFPPLLPAAEVAGGPQVVAGQVNFQQHGNVRTIEQQSGRAIINWQDFSIGAGDVTRFIQPGVDSAVLNRVFGANPSLLNGQLQANGSVYLINPNGIVVGPQGRIDVGAFYASTLNLSGDEFLKGGNLLFQGDSKAGIQNLGTINANDGDVMLIAYTVRNQGSITAPNGVAGAAAGSEVLLTPKGDQRLLVKSELSADKLEKGVENSGLMAAAQAELKAAGGLYQLAINQEGMVRATGVEQKNGRVLLTAESGAVKVSGEVTAKNANGSGGEIMVGGDYQGKNPAVANALTTEITDTARLDASASGANGNGGKIIVWSDGATDFKGSIAARGGSASGDGGLVEVSGKRALAFSGSVDTSATLGKMGRLLLDPDAIIIGDEPTQDILNFVNRILIAENVPSYLNAATLSGLLANNDVEVKTSDFGEQGLGAAGFNGISVNSDVTWNSASTLSLVSGDTIKINANITGGANSGLELHPGAISLAESTVATLSLAVNKTITVGTIGIGKSDIAPPGGTDLGTIDLGGTVNADTIFLRRFAGGIVGSVLINNPNNKLGTVYGLDSADAITGDLKIHDSMGGLTLSGDFSRVAGAVEILTSGNLTLDTDTMVKNTGASDLLLAALGGNFFNNSGATAVEASGSGRFLIYADSHATSTMGGLAGANLFGRTFGANAPASITHTGDRFIFGSTPTLTFTADNKTRGIGLANPALTYSVSGLVSGDTLGSAVTGTPILATTADLNTGVGTVPITIANGSLALTDIGYELALQNGVLTLTAEPLIPLTITANSFSRIYGTANPTFTAAYLGFADGDTETVVSGLQFSTAATISSGVGGYTITPFGATAVRYEISYVPGTLSITPADLTIRANDFSRLYGAANPDFTATFTGLVDGDSASVVTGLELATTALTGSSVGDYSITASGASAANYNISYTPGTLTINKAPLTITADNQSKTYGSMNPALTASYTGLVNGDTDSAVTGLALATTAETASGVGYYPITLSGASAVNYDLTLQPGTLAVNPATLTVSANSFTRSYGNANPTLTGSISGFVLGQDESIVSGLGYSTAATVLTGVGNYAITPSGASAPNYVFSYQNGNLHIDPAVLTVRANNQTRVYGDGEPTLSYSILGSLKNGDLAEDVFFISLFGSLGSSIAPVGNYTVLMGGFSVNNNYQVFFANGTETITPRPLTIRTDNVSREYGLPNPTFTATFTGLAPHDDPSVIPGLGFTTLANINSGVQTLGVTPISGNNANYSISRLPGQLTITPAPVFYSIGTYSKLYGRANPAFDISYFSGLRNGDSEASLGAQVDPAILTARNVGGYDINLTLANPNYYVGSTPGILNITPAPLTVSIVNQSRTFGEPNPADPAMNVIGLAFGEQAADIVHLNAHPATQQSDASIYFRNVTLTSPNYLLSGMSGGQFTILARNIILKPKNIVRYYGDYDPAFEVLVGGEGLAPFHTTADLVNLVYADGNLSLAPGAEVGVRKLLLDLIPTGNYNIQRREGLHYILPRPITITVDDIETTVGFPMPDFNFKADNLAFFDNEHTAFPSLNIGLYYVNQAAQTGTATPLNGVLIPNAYTDSLPLTPINTPLPPPSSDGVQTVQFVPITITLTPTPELTTSTILLDNLSFTPGSFNLNLLTQEEKNSTLTPAGIFTLPDVIKYAVPMGYGLNRNYVATSVKVGKVTIHPDPARVQHLKELEQKAKDKLAVEHARTTFATGSGGFGLPPELNNQIRIALAIALDSEIKNNIGGDSSLRRLILGEEWYLVEKDPAKMDAAITLWLSDFHTNKEKQGILMPAFTSYVSTLAQPGAVLNSGQKELLNVVGKHVAAARDKVMGVAVQKRDEYFKAEAAKMGDTGPSLSTLYGNPTVPWDSFIETSTKEVTESTINTVIAGTVVGAGVTAGASIGVGVGITAAFSTLFPHTALTASAVATGPAAIVGAAVVVAVIRGIQVAEETKAQDRFNKFTTDYGTPVDMVGYASNDANKAWMLIGLLNMMSGQ